MYLYYSNQAFCHSLYCDVQWLCNGQVECLSFHTKYWTQFLEVSTCNVLEKDTSSALIQSNQLSIEYKMGPP